MTSPLPFIDFHTHHDALEGEIIVRDGVHTRGRHPWTVAESDDRPHPMPLLAIGESGLDRLCQTPYDQQLEAFRAEVERSETLRLPLFLHCVRAIDDVVAIHRQLHATQPWIWHGFRGGPTQLQQLLQPPYNFFFSFGFHYRTEALLVCPPDRMLLETDDVAKPVRLVYEQVARDLGMPMSELVRQMHTNFKHLFG